MKWSFSQPIPGGCGEQLISVLGNNLLLSGRLLSWCPLAAFFLKPSKLCFSHLSSLARLSETLVSLEILVQKGKGDCC